MQIININQSFKMGDLLSFADGYYEIAEESMPVLLKAKDGDETTEIGAGSIIKIERADSPFHPMVVLTNCDSNVSYYIQSVFQGGPEILFDHADKTKSK